MELLKNTAVVRRYSDEDGVRHFIGDIGTCSTSTREVINNEEQMLEVGARIIQTEERPGKYTNVSIDLFILFLS
jgi:hypothetical protein